MNQLLIIYYLNDLRSVCYFQQTLVQTGFLNDKGNWGPKDAINDEYIKPFNKFIKC